MEIGNGNENKGCRHAATRTRSSGPVLRERFPNAFSAAAMSTRAAGRFRRRRPSAAGCNQDEHMMVCTNGRREVRAPAFVIASKRHHVSRVMSGTSGVRLPPYRHTPHVHTCEVPLLDDATRHNSGVLDLHDDAVCGGEGRGPAVLTRPQPREQLLLQRSTTHKTHVWVVSAHPGRQQRR